jgi:hypothetical protein
MRGLDSRGLAALVALVSLAASIARTLAGGQDLNFDLISYHYYLGFSAFSDRLGLDYLAAGAAGYQSPLPYALLYFLDSVGVPPIVNAALHAAIHALNLWLLFLLARILVSGTAAVLLCWLLGAIAPVYWQLVGTSFADPLTSVLVLGALWFAATAPHSARNLVLAGLLAGVALAMRLHTAIFVVALVAALGGLRSALVFSAAAAAAWLACFAPWAWRLTREFGSPLFPLFNALLGSPDFPAVNLHLVSFVPGTFTDALLLPFRMATFQDWRFGERPFPDVRPALLVLSAAACAAAWAHRRVALQRSNASIVMRFFLIAALLWLATSSNTRYGAPLFLLAGPVCGRLLSAVLPARYVLLTIGAALLWQGVQHQLFFKQYRWESGPWAARLFDWQLPPRLAAEPAVYLGFGYKTASTLAPRVHPASRHVALVAQYSVGLDHPGAQRIRKMIAAPPGRIYGVFDYDYTQQDDPAAKSIKTYFAEHLRLWGLDFTAEPCAVIALRPAPGEFRGKPPQYILCELASAAAKDRDAMLVRYREFEKMLAPLAAACPGVLGEAVSIVRVHGQWQVTSFASAEFRLEFDDSGAFNLQLLRPPYAAVPLGKVAGGAILLRQGACPPRPFD